MSWCVASLGLLAMAAPAMISGLELDERLYLAPSVRFSPDDKHKAEMKQSWNLGSIAFSIFGFGFENLC